MKSIMNKYEYFYLFEFKRINFTGQSDDLAETTDCASESVYLTSQVAESPWSTKEETVDAFREETNDNTKIGDGQVDD